MADYDNTNRGALFTNKRKTKDTHPAFTGRLNVEGKDYWLSAWGKTSKDGQKYLSISIEPAGEATKNDGPKTFEEFDDDIPF